MKKIITSVLIGALVGVMLAFIFLFVRVKFADGLADFLTKERTANAPISELIKSPFGPKTDQYRISAHDASVPVEGKAVLANLGEMKITMYENGQQVGEYPIKSVGREGTAWQTPIGQFDMSYKKENHFSSIGHVWMPFSMHFFGNYFIHGWPYYPDGTPVPKGYSGGCIRMETVDAEQVFNFVDSDTTLVVVKSSDEAVVPADFSYDVTEYAPEVSASAYIVADLETGEVVAGKNQKAAGAGDFAKIMTAIISLESLNQYHDVALNGQLMTIGDVLYSLILTDSDEAAGLLYDRRNHAQYLIDMDDRAKSIGMTQTIYEDVYGNDPETKSTLEDTFRLVQYIKWYKPFLFKALGKTEYEKDDISFESVHPLKDMDEYVSGFANAEGTSAMTVVSVKPSESSEEKAFAIIVQGSQNAGRDTAELIDWIQTSVRVR
jgi:hypothetical protein